MTPSMMHSTLLPRVPVPYAGVCASEALHPVLAISDSLSLIQDDTVQYIQIQRDTDRDTCSYSDILNNGYAHTGTY